MWTPPAKENHNELWYGWLSVGLEEKKNLLAAKENNAESLTLLICLCVIIL